MSSEERPESLAAQAASWVPPWERRREPDRAFQEAAVEAPADPAADEDPAPVAAQVHTPDPDPAVDEVAASVYTPEPDPGPDPAADEVAAPVHTPEPGPDPAAGDVTAPVDTPEPDADPDPAVGEVAAPMVAEVHTPAAVPAQPRRVRQKPEPVTPAPAPMGDAELAAALESIMLVVDEPTGELQLAQVLEQPVERIARALENISARYTAAGHGIDLRRVAGGWRLYTRPEYAAYVERFVLDGQSVRLTQAALETLAVVAYKQPVTRSRISAIRGVNCDGVMRTLVTRGLIEECGTEPETGAHLYRTTPLFLEKLGLNTVGQLPPLAPFLPDDVEEVLDASG
ncbi:SMC-Scp complex subunit ScpB [Actinoplanes utahensis]|uniref:RNA 3-phosphate cyclase n=1 Tax=Actinoplanes utahensis TaxID=1869 RepID=A0A0A6UHQ4_ACTUT|nr:SMC-Scp complex subunit ScpB [Actinoplanes utahensis]KHD74981.1 RNA 3-phosphate cyclase [Actinoplanes utahensis]GIF34921.1 hypothetical protein Aut01nite_79070 [Actinoplanes utahensis]